MSSYDFLFQEKGPKVIDEALKFLGTKEITGPQHNQVIMDWAKKLGLKSYNADEIPWCGLFVAIVVYNTDYDVVKDPLWAANWAKFGTAEKTAMKGDILVFKRPGGNHVGFYIGEDDKCYHVLGGNQSNMVNIIRIEKSRCTHIRRCPWKMGKPATVRQIKLNATGHISSNEA